MNILWIITDQHHAGCLGAAGHPDVRTPNLDRLAAEGVRFERAYCNNPICAPSRCSMITGLYPWSTGITGNRVRDLELPDQTTLAAELREAGYETALVGKSHMPRLWDEAGFEHTRYCDLCDADEGDPMNVAYFRHLAEQGLADEYDLGTRYEGEEGYQLRRFISKIPLESNLEKWTGDEAIRFLEERDTSRPFFLQLGFQRPHEPLCIPPEIEDWYESVDITLPPGVEDYFKHRFAGKPIFQQNYIREGVMGYPYRPLDEDDLKGQMAYYFTLVTLIDQQIGRVLKALADAGNMEDTLVIYTSDHGDFAGEHGLALKNLGIYESIHRVPLILRIPGGPSGCVNDAIVELVDIMPTVLELAGVPVPDGLDGRSLLPVIAGNDPGKASTTCLFDFNRNQPCAVAIRTKTHRLVEYPWQPEEAGELYDHTNDPEEIVNLWSDPQHIPLRLELTRGMLAALSHFKRTWPVSHDAKLAAATQPSASRHLQELGAKWSDIHEKNGATAVSLSTP